MSAVSPVGPESVPSGLRSGPQALLLATWACIGIGDMLNNGAYGLRPLVWVSAGISLLLVAVVARLDVAGAVPVALTACFGAVVVQGWHWPGEIYGSGRLLVLSRHLWIFGAALAVLLVLIGRRRPPPAVCFGALAAVTLAADTVGIEASRRPAIDVWFMYQSAADSLAGGHNFYLTHWSSGIPGEVADKFVYLPFSVVVLAPFRWLFGDVRFGLVALTLLAAVVVYLLVDDELRWALAGLVLLFPKTTFAVEQSWNDIGLVALLGLVVLLVVRGRPGWAVVPLALAVAFKQYAWLALPAAAVWPRFGWRRTALATSLGAAACLPWFLTAPHAFWVGAVSYNLHLVPRPDSLSWYSYLLLHGHNLGYVLIVAGTAAGLAVGLAGVRTGRFGLGAAAALTMAGFNLASKQAFFNEWELLAGLLVVAVAEARDNPLTGRSSPSLSPAVPGAEPVPSPSGGSG